MAMALALADLLRKRICIFLSANVYLVRENCLLASNAENLVARSTDTIAVLGKVVRINNMIRTYPPFLLRWLCIGLIAVLTIFCLLLVPATGASAQTVSTSAATVHLEQVVADQFLGGDGHGPGSGSHGSGSHGTSSHGTGGSTSSGGHSSSHGGHSSNCPPENQSTGNQSTGNQPTNSQCSSNGSYWFIVWLL